jgi:hypothetical protein
MDELVEAEQKWHEFFFGPRLDGHVTIDGKKYGVVTDNVTVIRGSKMMIRRGGVWVDVDAYQRKGGQWIET